MRSWFFLMGAVLAAWAVTPSQAQKIQAQTVDPAEIARLENYLNSVRTLRSGFVQTSTNGGVAEGTLYLQRPGNMRIDYRPPTPLQIFADGTWLTYVDQELKEVNRLPLSATPAGFLLQDKISLSGDVTVKRLTRRRGTINLHLAQTDESDLGRLIVTLTEAPVSLRGWTVIDGQGIETTVTLIGPDINKQIARRTFVFDAPDWARDPQE
ncbi:MAG: outer membrane lipoprotein carrier protein LolA [Rhodospirillaceae bacterium]|jgi:outer membrane lipoprotein-sorting protein|nr:outer membrane lipoprotein carrier protein LolA [Rhodospirillaceae bacterium]MBT5455789.1 outer membrane lipoprotein carrier protein LolA [Rhodospirillaceae bacterium]